MLRFLKQLLFSIIVLALIAAAGLYGVKWFRGDVTGQSQDIQFIEQTGSSNIRLRLKSMAGDVVQEYDCLDGECIELNQYSVKENGVSAGDWLFFFGEASNSEGLVGKALLKVNRVSGEQEIIVAESRLTSPRDLILSPNERYLGFFLDNDHEPEKSLTELWVYDIQSGEKRVVVENMYKPDIKSNVRWNSSSTVLWFVADNGDRQQAEDQLEIVTAHIAPVEVKARFGTADLENLLEGIDDKLRIDISPSAEYLAYVQSGLLSGSKLVVVGNSGAEENAIRGEVERVAWASDNKLFYVIQNRAGFTLWQLNERVIRTLGRRSGIILALTSYAEGEKIILVSKENDRVANVYSVLSDTGAFFDEGFIVEPEERIEIINVEKKSISSQSDNKKTRFDDAQLIAFIERHFENITGETGKAKRIIITDSINTLLIDYQTKDFLDQRIMVIVSDLIHPEWSITGRYRIIDGQWNKYEGDNLDDPAAVHIYEWEEEINQWVLKEKL
jgi:hypothetical protein